MEGFAVTECGDLILLDECGNFEYASQGRFEVRFAERTCTYVEHSGALYHYYECSERQYEMDGGDFEHYEPARCMGCGAKIVEVVS